MEAPLDKRGWLKAALLEGVVVTLLLVGLGFFYLRPASTELLRGNAAVMVGEEGDSVTNVWQYQLVIDVLKSHPQDLLFGTAVYSDQMNAPEGAAHFIPWIERFFVILFAPFMRADLMPTAMVWAFMVLSGLSFHAYGRALGWSRPVAFALGLAWAYCPYTRARAVCHIALVGTYWAPIILLALYLLARPPRHWSMRGTAIVSAALLLFAIFAGHYYVVTAAVMAPVFLLYYVLLVPRTASRLGAAGRLVLAVMPAALFCLWSLAVPMPSYGIRAVAPIKVTRSETDQMLMVGGAHPIDYVVGDMKFGSKDLLPFRGALTEKARKEVPINNHERTNGIRWFVLACCAALLVTLLVPRLRRRLSKTERILGGFAFAFAGAAFLLALSPQGLRVYDTDLGPIQFVAKRFPKYRVPNRIGILVHLGALLGAGVLLDRVTRRHLKARSPRGIAIAAALPALSVVDYAPLHAMLVQPVIARYGELQDAAAAQGLPCGAGMTVPYVTWGFFDYDYYKSYSSLRGTSCKLLHSAYLTSEDELLRLAVSVPTWNGDRAQAERLARCAGASWVMFRLDRTEEYKRAFCAEMGWSFVSSDACRAPISKAADMPRPRSLRECVAELGLERPK